MKSQTFCWMLGAGGAATVMLAVLVATQATHSGPAAKPRRSVSAAAAGLSHPQAPKSTAPSAAIQRMLAGEPPRLTPDQIREYVESQDHRAPAIIAAWHLSRDPAWLALAAERFPDDPAVAAAILLAGEDGMKAGGDTAHWVEVLKTKDPDNALASLYAAKGALVEGRTEKALSELDGLAPSSHLHLPTEAWAEAMTDAYGRFGYQGLEGEWAARSLVPGPWKDLHTLTATLAGAMTRAAECDDRQAAASLGEAALKMADMVMDRSGPESLLTRFVGLSMARQVLAQLDGFDLVPGETTLVVERLSEMDREAAGLKTLMGQSQRLLPTLTDIEAQQYTRRVRVEGEVKALRWLVSRRRQ